MSKISKADFENAVKKINTDILNIDDNNETNRPATPEAQNSKETKELSKEDQSENRGKDEVTS